MCTAISFANRYFGRNLDLEYRYDEAVVITPRAFPLEYRSGQKELYHFSIIGIASVIDGQPLYYDATNEKELSMAALNFTKSAVYFSPSENKINIAHFELIPKILASCSDVSEAVKLLKEITVTDLTFNDSLPLSRLHWVISDRERTVTVESLYDGLHIYENKVGVLTNEPPFDFHMQNLVGYMNISSSPAENRFSDKTELIPYSHGMGAIGLPGDLSSISRFVRACFTKLNSPTPKSESEAISQFFHILAAVEMCEGSVKIGNAYEKTQYSSCCDTERKIYYYKTYPNSRINAVSLFDCDIKGSELTVYPLSFTEDIYKRNF